MRSAGIVWNTGAALVYGADVVYDASGSTNTGLMNDPKNLKNKIGEHFLLAINDILNVVCGARF